MSERKGGGAIGNDQTRKWHESRDPMELASDAEGMGHTIGGLAPEMVTWRIGFPSEEPCDRCLLPDGDGQPV
jgi:hypothetical protein